MVAWLSILIVLVILFVLYWLFLSPYSQVFGYFPYKFKTTKKEIALTFDDGPNEPYTSQLLDFFDENSIKATFFVVGENVKKYPEIVRRMAKSGHSIGAHSLNHRFANYLLHPSYLNEIVKSKDLIFRTTGQNPQLFRPPWLWRHPVILNRLKNAEMIPVSGVFCSNLEVFKPKSSYIARKAINKVRPGSIIIFHDGYNSKGTNRQNSVDAVKVFVSVLQKKGYKFIALDSSILEKNY